MSWIGAGNERKVGRRFGHSGTQPSAVRRRLVEGPGERATVGIEYGRLIQPFDVMKWSGDRGDRPFSSRRIANGKTGDLAAGIVSGQYAIRGGLPATVSVVVGYREPAGDCIPPGS
jgi:hypothetical protein